MTNCVPGCFFVIRRDAFDDISLFDERTFLFGEETILGFKLSFKGYKVCIVNDTQILHENSVSINANISSFRKKAKIRLQSELIYLKDYLGCNKMVCKLYELSYWFGFSTNSFVYSVLGINKKTRSL